MGILQTLGLEESDTQFEAKNFMNKAKTEMQNAQNQSDYYNTQGQNYQGLATGAFNNALGYYGKAGNAYGTLLGYGGADRNAYLSGLSRVLPAYAAYNLLDPRLGQSPYGSGQYGGQGGPNYGGQGQGNLSEARQRDAQPYRTITPQLSRGGLSYNQQVNTPYDQRQTPIAGGAQGGPGTAPQPGFGGTTTGQPQDNGGGYDPYGVTTPQQAMLNQQVTGFRAQEAAAQAQYDASYARRGMVPPPLGKSQISEHYGALAQQAQAAYLEQARQSKAQATAGLLNMYNAYGPMAASETGAGAAGLGTVGAGIAGVGQNFAGMGATDIATAKAYRDAILQWQQAGFNARAGADAQQSEALGATLGTAATIGSYFLPRPGTPQQNTGNYNAPGPDYNDVNAGQSPYYPYTPSQVPEQFPTYTPPGIQMPTIPGANGNPAGTQQAYVPPGLPYQPAYV